MMVNPGNSFIGLLITRNRQRRELHLSQPHYIETMLEKFNMTDCNPRNVPADPNGRITKLMSPADDKEEMLMINTPYEEAVGSLLYASITTRPVICYAVSQVAQFSHNPGPLHWEAVKRIFAYLKGTINHGILFVQDKTGLIAYADADYAGDTDTRRSTTGYILTLNNGPIAWCSRRQKSTTLSTTEAEYVAACETTK